MTKKKTRQPDTGLFLWNAVDLWKAVEPCLHLKDAELAAALRRHFIEVIQELTRNRSAETTAWSKEESDFLQSFVTLTEELRKKIDSASENDAGARVLRRLAPLMKVKITKEELDSLVSSGKLSLEAANELWDIWSWPPADPSAEPIREFRHTLVRIRRAANPLARLPKRKSWGQTKSARDTAIKGLWEIWRKSPASQSHPRTGGKTPSAFLSFVDTINRGLPSELQLGKRKQVQDTINRKNLLASRPF
jgi:hypothetical protein